MRLPEPQERLGTDARIHRLEVLERGHRLRLMERGLLPREEASSLSGGADRGLEGRLGIADGQRAMVMMGELGGHRVEGAAMSLLESLGHHLVETGSRPTGEPGVDRLLEERVGEAMSDRARILDGLDETRPGGLIDE